MPAYKLSHLDGLSFFDKEYRANKLARYLALVRLLSLHVPSSNYDEAREYVELQYMRYALTHNFDNPNSPDQAIAFRNREIALINELGMRLPYHAIYPEWWVKRIADTAEHALSGVIEEEIRHAARITRTYYKFQFGLEDMQYLQRILEDYIVELATETTHSEAAKRVLSRLKVAVQWFEEQSKSLALREFELNLSYPLDDETKTGKTQRKHKIIKLEDCLTSARFTRNQLDKLLLNVGLVEFSASGDYLAKEPQKSWQWASVRAALQDQLLFKPVSHEQAALVFQQAYGAKVKRGTMNFTPDLNGRNSKLPQNAFYSKVMSMLPPVSQE